MAKAEYIDYSRTPPFVDGVPITRIQRIDAPLDLAIEKTRQLGDEGVVQNIRGVPSFTVTIDENFIGSIDNLALFTDRMVPYGLADLTGTVDARELRYADTIATPNSATRGGDGKVNHSHIKTSYCDLMYPVAHPDDDKVIRTVYFHRLALTGISGNFDVNDNATFSYTFSGSQMYYLLNTWDSLKCYVLKNIEVATFAPTTGSAQSFWINDTAFPDGCTVQAVFFDRHTAFSNNDTDWTFEDKGVSGNLHYFRLIREDSSSYKSTPWCDTSASSPEKVTFLFTHSCAANDEDTYSDIQLTSTSGSMGALTKEYINFYLWNSAYASKSTPGAAGTFERVQNFTFNANPESEDKFQLGDRYPYAVERKSPVDVNGTVSLLASDIEALAVACGTATGNLNLINDGMFQDSINFQIDIYRDRNKDEADRTCRIKISNCSLNGLTEGLSVDGSATLELGFESDNIYFESTGVDPNA